MTVILIQDTHNPHTASRLTTFEITIAKPLLAQIKNHRTIVSNAASSRAIPTEKIIRQVIEDPYIPPKIGTYGKGMQPAEYLTGNELDSAENAWWLARVGALDSAAHMRELGMSKELVNRVLEPWTWTKVVATAPLEAWEHFIGLRDKEDAQIDLQVIAQSIRELLDTSTPKEREMHTPYSATGDPLESVEACARVSYGNPGTRQNTKPGDLYKRLLDGKHMSPFEHVAWPLSEPPVPTYGPLGPNWRTLRNALESGSVGV